MAKFTKLSSMDKDEARECLEKLMSVVETDETYVSGKAKGKKHTRRRTIKAPVAALVQRNGEGRSRYVQYVNSANL
jgi:hypothetical protein